MKIYVYTYGVFDLLHPGHIILLNKAKALGDYLIVGIVSDKAVKELKGVDRPILFQKDRATLIGNLKCVDEVIYQDEYDPTKQIKNYPYNIDILVKGDDWEYIPGTETVESSGGKLVKLSYSTEYSTSAIIEKIRRDKC
jgi:D-glycero-beta-D-manno-heptose 1-phosphate adenylyltransferase